MLFRSKGIGKNYIKREDAKYKLKDENQIATKAIRLVLENIRKTTKSIKHWFITEKGHNETERLHLHGTVWGIGTDKLITEKSVSNESDRIANDLMVGMKDLDRKDRELIKDWIYEGIHAGKEISGEILNWLMRGAPKTITEVTSRLEKFNLMQTGIESITRQKLNSEQINYLKGQLAIGWANVAIGEKSVAKDSSGILLYTSTREKSLGRSA